jgi:acyl carrier protein phosphodiesterase
MNFLAHCVVADKAADQWESSPEFREGLVAGAVIADFIKGPINSNWPKALQAGIRLHRRIDAFSNLQQGIKNTCDRFPPEYRRYAPIFVDLLADYFLSIYWEDFHNQPKTAFSASCYHALSRYQNFLSPNGLRFLAYAQENDLFASYDQWENIQIGLISVLRRLNKQEWFEDVDRCAQSLRTDALPDFHIYYSELLGQLPNWHTWINQ